MHFKPMYRKLVETREYKNWRSKNPSFTLAHVFYMNDKANEGIWHIGFFDPKSDSITTFVLKHESIKIVPAEEIFKKAKTLVKKLDPEKIRFEFDAALEKAREFMKKEYRNEHILKEIIILQHIEQGQVYNITFLLASFKTLNIKIDAGSGEIVSHHKDSFMEFDKGTA